MFDGSQDLGCNLIEKAAVDRAARDMDVALDQALMQRRVPGNQLHEIFKEQQRFLRVLPDALSPKREGGLLPHQRRVYEDFARLLRERPSMQAVASGQGQPNMAASAGMDKAVRSFNEAPNQMVAPNHMPQGLGPQAQVQQPMPPRMDPINQAQMQAIRQMLEKCMTCMAKAEELVMGSFNVLAGSSLSALPAGHELAQLIMQARALVLQVQGPNREELAVAFSQKLFVRLYDKTKFGRCRLGVDWILAVLSTLNEVTKRVSKEITNWMAGDAERKLNQELTVALVGNRLMSIGRYIDSNALTYIHMPTRTPVVCMRVDTSCVCVYVCTRIYTYVYICGRIGATCKQDVSTRGTHTLRAHVPH